jgi:putative PEP-CTERM system histidine kinase
MNIGLYSYLGSVLAYSAFALLLMFSWGKSVQGKLLVIVAVISVIWSVTAIQVSLHNESYLLTYQLFEILRYTAWYYFLLKLFATGSKGVEQVGSSYTRFNRWALPLSIGATVFLMVNVVLAGYVSMPGQFVLGIAGNVVLALAGIAILEQLYRNMSSSSRWATKFLFLGAGGIFTYDFYMYADALLFRSIDQELWNARGFVHLVAVPLLAIASARNKNWSLNIFVSRDIVLNTTAILAGGFYLLFMAVAGYYLREYGGSWGRVGQIMVFVLAIVLLFALLSSTQLRAQIRVFLGKHFYKNKYDYRIEWLRLTDDLNDGSAGSERYQSVIEAMAHIVDARAGQLWLVDDNGNYSNAVTWQVEQLPEIVKQESSLIDYFERTGYVINFLEIESKPTEYEGLELPGWLQKVDHAWLAVPLRGPSGLIGFVILISPLVIRSINWEDRDLLKAAAKQVSSHLMVLMTSEQLAQARQFEVFSRLSAYMVHDLKNIAAELELISINAKKHTDNPAFIEDAFETVENASSDINRLLDQLRNKRMQNEKKVQVDLKQLIDEVVNSKQHKQPRPSFEIPQEVHMSTLEKGRFSNVLAHLIENAQQATEDDGDISISLLTQEGMHHIEIKDTGSGMDDDFIRNRLFRAFDTTKGNAGMGIGMFESREFIRDLGGDIGVQSKPGKGSIITLIIPAA